MPSQSSNTRRTSADCLFEGDTVLHQGKRRTITTYIYYPSGNVIVILDDKETLSLQEWDVMYVVE